MSSPAPAPAPPAAPPRGRLTPPRLLLAVAFAAVGFVAVWQGFGLAGFGTDAHALRVFAAIAPLFACGLALAWPRMRLPVRVLTAIAGAGVAGYAWWEVRSAGHSPALSLREAVAERDRYAEQLAVATFDDVERGDGLGGIQGVVEQYPRLTADLAAGYEGWKTRMTDELVGRFERTPAGDLAAGKALFSRAGTLSAVHKANPDRINAAWFAWHSRAIRCKVDELEAMSGDWAAFERTAPGRRALVTAFPSTHAPERLFAAEEDWANASVEQLTRPRADGVKTKVDWLGADVALRAAPALDPRPDHFARARRRLFELAHQAAQAEVTAHLEAGRSELAFGLARKHAVEWNATATMLGADEVKKLDSLRETCEFFSKLASKAAPPPDAADIAPPPRTKPEK